MRALQGLLDLVIPPTCAGCGREDAVLCDGCRVSLDRRLHEPPGMPVGLPATLPDGIVQLEWCGAFSGPVRDAILALKYKGQRRLAAPLGAAVASRWAHAGAGGDVLTWVPVHVERERDRGFDQAELLARAAGATLGLPVERLLERSLSTSAMHRLGRGERSRNVLGAFRVASGAQGRLSGRWPVIVDDVVTTGATLAGCASVLDEAGVLATSAVAVARDR